MKPTLKRRLVDFPLGKQLRFLVGSALLRTRQADAAEIDAAPFSREWTPFQRLLRNGLYYQALRTRDFTTLGRYLKNYYPYRFQASGYRVRFMHERLIDGQRWINLLAEYPGTFPHSNK